MVAERILVVDAGTSSLRAVAVGERTLATVAAEPWRMLAPQDAAPFGREFDPHEVARALRRILDRASGSGPFAAVAFAGQREGLAFLDGATQALYAGPNIDARASAEGMETDAVRAEQVYRATGHLPSLLQAPAKLEWMRRHRPDAAARVRLALPLADWLAHLASAGEPAMSRGLAAENGLLDITADGAPAHLAACGFDPRLLPPVVADGAVVGAIGEGALAGTPVVLAGADTQCALAGMRALAPGDCAVPAGWSAPVQVVTAEPVFDAAMRTWTSVHVAPRRYVLESNAGETGRAWAWACSLTGRDPAEAAVLAGRSPAGADDMMMVLGARTMRAAAMNAGVGGLTVPLPLALWSPGVSDALRAVLEAAAFAVRANVEQLEEIGGARIDRLRLAGGMSAAPVFAQIVADVIDRPLEVSAHPEATAVGAAALASVALGRHPAIEDAARALAAMPRIVEPDMAASVVCEDAYGRWCAMADAFDRMAAEGA